MVGKIKKILIVLVSLSVLVLLGILSYGRFKGRSLPGIAGSITIQGVESPVEIIRDSHGIPHIYADNRHDMFFAQGFVHAQDRFWQMEFWRRIGSGRLSELFGSSQLQSDIFLRTMDFKGVAEEEFKMMEPEFKDYLEAYSDGVNAWIFSRKPEKLALEFSLLKLTGVEFDIEPWTPINSLTWGKVMAYDLNGNMLTEKLLMETIRSVGLDSIGGYFSPYRDDIPFIVSKEEYESYRRERGLEITENERPGSDDKKKYVLGSNSSIGSNSWVVSGSLTESGKPLLANDVHLGIQMPSIWYEVDMNCGGTRQKGPDPAGKPMHVKGFSFPGTPGVIIGHNDDIAWGFTNLMMDVQDLYIEKLNTANTDLYLKDGDWVPMKIKFETIKIHKEDDPYILRVRQTAHGPILGTGMGPMPGWINDYDWKGMIPYEDMPASLNPEKGYIVAANNAVIDRFYPYYLSSDYTYGFRAKRIAELIEQSQGKISIDQIISIHGDVLNFTAMETIPYVNDKNLEQRYNQIVEDKTEKERMKDLKTLTEAYTLLKEWDGIQKREGKETVIYAYFWHKLVQFIFKDQFPEDQWPPKSLVRFENSIMMLLKDSENPWWDDRNTPEIIEKHDEIITRAFIEGVLTAAEHLGSDIQKWEWGSVHQAEFKNQTLGNSGIRLIENIFNRGPYPVDGGASQINVSSWEFDKPFSVYHIASLRMIINLDDLSDSLLIHPTGQSGHPASKHYDDFLPLWQNVRYHTNLWDKEEILKDNKKTLMLLPRLD